MNQHHTHPNAGAEHRSKGAAIIGGREEQQDAFIIVPASDPHSGAVGELLVLADGMGGHSGGQEASASAVKAFVGEFATNNQSIQERLLAALHSANDAIADQIKANARLKGMGCTLTGAFVTQDKAVWISVGDSPMYLQDDDKLERVNEDHSLAPKIDLEVAQGKRTAESAKNDPSRHALLSALTGRKIPMVDQGVTILPMGSKLVLASDGLDTLESAEIFRILDSNESAQRAVDALLQNLTSVMPPDQDNTTVIVFQRDELEAAKPLVPDQESHRASLPIIAFGLLCFALAIAAITALFLIGDEDGAASSASDPSTAQPAPVPSEQDVSPTQVPSDEDESGATVIDESDDVEIPLEGIQRYNEEATGEGRINTNPRTRNNQRNSSPSTPARDNTTPRGKAEEKTPAPENTPPPIAAVVDPEPSDTNDGVNNPELPIGDANGSPDSEQGEQADDTPSQSEDDGPSDDQSPNKPGPPPPF